MNEVLEEFSASSPQYQSDVRIRLNKYMAKNPLPLTVHARGAGVSHNSLYKLLRGDLVTNMVVFKIDNYINGDE